MKKIDREIENRFKDTEGNNINLKIAMKKIDVQLEELRAELGKEPTTVVDEKVEIDASIVDPSVLKSLKFLEGQTKDLSL